MTFSASACHQSARQITIIFWCLNMKSFSCFTVRLSKIETNNNNNDNNNDNKHAS